MNLTEFKIYQKSIPDFTLRLDDLNPFELSDYLSLNGNTISSSNWIAKFFSNEDWKIREGFGVRHLMELCFKELAKKKNTLILPQDVYPVYTELAANYFDTIRYYKTYPVLEVHELNYSNAVLIFTNPLTPIGRYASNHEIDLLDQWLKSDKSRYVIIDSCYNFFESFTIKKFNGVNVIELISTSKIFLRRKEKGWMITKNFEFEIENCLKELQLIESTPEILEASFKMAWENISPVIKKINSEWKRPEISYLSVINTSYKELLERGIAAIPASLFGSEYEDTSVLSILGLLKK